MPFVRGRHLPEVQSTGCARRAFRILLWGNDWSRQNTADLNDVEVLREYLLSLRPCVCEIRLFVPDSHDATAELVGALNIRFATVPSSRAPEGVSKRINNEELADAVQTALVCDADVLVVTNNHWLPYINELDTLGVFLTDTGFLKRQCEVFVCGNDVPWAFSSAISGLTWTGFYQITEQQTFEQGMQLLYMAQQKNSDGGGLETGRSLIHNRLPNLCFTRDRLLFYEIQRRVATRAQWTRQEFTFEVAYYLNFYYLLIYGGFDHAALMVSQLLGLGLSEKSVGAAYKSFLEPLKSKHAGLYGVFTDVKQIEFMKRIGALRHLAAHRGSLMPTKLVEKPDKEPSSEELDAEISKAGADEVLRCMPEGKLRESIRETIRYNFRMTRYEKRTIADGIVPIMIDGKFGFIHPAADTDWNFQKFLTFLNRVFSELVKL